jgi:hypothetical protein
MLVVDDVRQGKACANEATDSNRLSYEFVEERLGFPDFADRFPAIVKERAG